MYFIPVKDIVLLLVNNISGITNDSCGSCDDKQFVGEMEWKHVILYMYIIEYSSTDQQFEEKKRRRKYLLSFCRRTDYEVKNVD